LYSINLLCYNDSKLITIIEMLVFPLGVPAFRILTGL
jgi:hypothetical protein